MDDIVILLAEDDIGHATLIRKNLERSGVSNKIIHFENGLELIEFLYDKENTYIKAGKTFLLILDIHMPMMDGIEVLKKLKTDETFKKIPIIMLTTTDNPSEVALCHELGCNSYVTKPIEYEDFILSLHSLGLYLRIIQIPKLQEKD